MKPKHTHFSLAVQASIFLGGLFCVLALASPLPTNQNNAKSIEAKTIISLQDPHGRQTPAKVFQEIADYLKEKEKSIKWDVYGDYETNSDDSFLRRFEAEIAQDFGMGDAVFMPSGGMAQSIALLIHRDEYKKRRMSHHNDNEKYRFVCHETSHLMLHEQESYRHLLNLEAVVVSTKEKAAGISIPPMQTEDIEVALLHATGNCTPPVVALILEVPHRELGGKLNSWEDLVKMREFCKTHDIAFHCDGARIFEASTGYASQNKTIKNLASGVFDSIYVSCYKGLGGLSGAFLLGDQSFCEEARVWLRRLGGNLYTLLPYVVSARMGYDREWKLEAKRGTPPLLSFLDKKEKLAYLVHRLSSHKSISQWLAFDPPVPESSMVHGYLKGCTLSECFEASLFVKQTTGVEIVRRFKGVDPQQAPSAWDHGYAVTFEWSMGQANAEIHEDLFLKSWIAFCETLEQIRSGKIVESIVVEE